MAINGKSVLAVIPARGGSKRVPMKNLKPYRGKPLLLWTIWAAQESVYIDQLAVSTDNEEIYSIASQFVLTLQRPLELATDTASSEDVLRDVMKSYRLDWIVLLQPTSPLRTGEDIDLCIERAQMGDGCISVDRGGRTNGAVYVAKSEWLAEHDFSHQGLMKYVMPDERGLDINTEEDFAA